MGLVRVFPQLGQLTIQAHVFGQKLIAEIDKKICWLHYATTIAFSFFMSPY